MPAKHSLTKLSWLVIALSFFALAILAAAGADDSMPNSRISPAVQQFMDRTQQLASDVRRSFPNCNITEGGPNGRTIDIVSTGKTDFEVLVPNSESAATQTEAVADQLKSRLSLGGIELKAMPPSLQGRLTTFRFQQTYNGIPVDDASIIAAFNRDGKLAFARINVVPGISIGTMPSLFPEDAQNYLSSTLRGHLDQKRPASATLVVLSRDKELPRLAYKVNVATVDPLGDWLAYVDAASGDLISETDVSVRNGTGTSGTGVVVNDNFDDPPSQVKDTAVPSLVQGDISMVWKKKGPVGLILAYDRMRGAEFAIEQVSPPPPQVGESGVSGLKSTTSGFADDYGHYRYTGPVGCDSFYVLYRIGNPIVKIKTYVNGLARQLTDSSDEFAANSSCGALETADHDWAYSPQVINNPNYIWDLSIAHYHQDMYYWFRSLLGSAQYWPGRCSTYTWDSGLQEYGLTGFYSFPSHVIALSPYGTTFLPSICHEMSHAVVMQSLAHVGAQLMATMNEGMADYFAARYLDQQPIIRDLVSMYTPIDSGGWLANSEVHALGGVLAHTWYDLGDSLPPNYVDSAVFFSLLLDPTTISEELPAVLTYDDNDANLSNGTPHSSAIFQTFADHWIGPDLPLVFIVDSCVPYGPTLPTGPLNGNRPVWKGSPDDSLVITLLDAYPMDSTVWNFGDGTAPITLVTRGHDNTTYVYAAYNNLVHYYDTCGDFQLICTAYHLWGTRTDTLQIEVRDPQGCPNYICGDVNNDRVVDVSDVTYMVAALFQGGPDPIPIESGDVDCNAGFNVSDLTWMVSYLYSGGPAPCSCEGNRKLSTVQRGTTVTANFEDSVTVLSLASRSNLQYLLLTLKGEDIGTADLELGDGIEMIQSRDGDNLTVCLLDLNGSNPIVCGESALCRIPGRYSLISASAEDMERQPEQINIKNSLSGTFLPTRFSLGQNYPNPFNPTTRIQFDVPVASEITLDVYNVAGQRVKTLLSGHREAGRWEIEWDGRDANGNEVSSGVYFYRITSRNFTDSKKMVLLK